jgi:glucosamine--fructose-6-phosphate aminotransferase (isomerizing)
MHKMLQEIREQPGAVERTVEHVLPLAHEFGVRMRQTEPRLVTMPARGTSDNVATFGKYMIEYVLGIPVSLSAPSIFTVYHHRLRLEDALAVGISQSGEAVDVTDSLRGARGAGATTAAITNNPGSPITEVVEWAFVTQAGPEQSVPATKTYTSALAAMYLLCACWAGDEQLIKDLDAVGDAIRRVLELEGEIDAAADLVGEKERCVVVSRGPNYATAKEIALKLTETCYILAQPFSRADFMHGPIAATAKGIPAVLIIPEGPFHDEMFELAQTLHDLGARTLIIGAREEICSVATIPVRIDVPVSELCSPMVYAVAGQLLAYHLSVRYGYDPDRPAVLRKVTRTR